MANQRGFTLIEIMMVLLIIGITVSVVMVNAFSTNHADELEKQVSRFQVVVDMASDFAVLNQQQLGIRLDKKQNSYSFLILGEEQKWFPIEDQATFATTELSEQFDFELQLDGLPWLEEDSLFDEGVFDEELSLDDDGVEIGNEEEKRIPPPQILLLSSGDITPFSLTFSYEPEFGNDDPVYFRVNGQETVPLIKEGPLDSL